MKRELSCQKPDSIYARLEYETMAFHSIRALDTANPTDKWLYGSFNNISRYAALLFQAIHALLNLHIGMSAPNNIYTLIRLEP